MSDPSSVKPSRDIAGLIEIMAQLRTPGTGCPWDLEQDFKSIAPYTIEEAYEVADAIERNDLADLKDELGDLLLQSIYHARLAEEAKAFDFSDVVLAVTTKMIRRHPHVFGDAAARSAGAAKGFWETIKAEEKTQKAAERARLGIADRTQASILADVPRGLPGLTRAMKLQAKAAAVGFDWPDIKPVLAKAREELHELEQAIATEGKLAAMAELGDLLFVLANVARHLDVEPEAAVRQTNEKFARRFAFIETALQAQGKTPAQSSLEEMDALWDAAKANERTTT